MTKKEKRARLELIVERFKEIYPEATCALEYGGDPWKLLVMGRLSAQCTDARVNIVCRELFREFPTPEDMASGELSEIERIVRPCGLYRMKASSIKEASRMLVEDYNGRIPDDIDELLKLPGVGRKIANLVLGDVYGLPSVVCDTHCMRICGRFGMYPESLRDPVKIEKILIELLPYGEGSDFCHRIVNFGREVCSARAPKCFECPMRDLCSHYEKVAKNG